METTSQQSTSTSSSTGSKQRKTSGFYPRKEAKAKAPLFKKTYDQASPELQSLINQVIDPDSVTDPVRWPMTYGLSATYKSINNYDAKFDDYGQSIAIAYPSLQNSIYLTAGTAYTQTLSTSAVTSGNSLNQIFQMSVEQPTDNITNPWFFQNNHAALPRRFGGSYLYPFTWNSADNTPVIDFQFSNITASGAGLLNVVTRWYDINGVQLHAVSAPVPAGGLLSQSLNPILATNLTFWMSFQVLYNGSSFYRGECFAEFRETGVAPFFQLTLSNTAAHCVYYDSNGSQVILDSAEKYFVSAQSMLCTYVGSDLQSGGNLSIAKVPSDTNLSSKTDNISDVLPQSNPYYSWVSSLSSNRYDGPIKDGGYCFYLGEDESSYFYDRVENTYARELPYIISAFNTTDLTFSGILRVKVISVIQFTTNNNIYSLQPSPYMRDIKMLHHILSLVPSAYCNPLHKKEIKEHLKKIGQRIAAEFKDPKNWISAAKMLGTILL